jgi:hypothetical protein
MTSTFIRRLAVTAPRHEDPPPGSSYSETRHLTLDAAGRAAVAEAPLEVTATAMTKDIETKTMADRGPEEDAW